jgi:hypothetical protein
MPLHDISEPHAYSHSISFHLMPSHAISCHLIPSRPTPIICQLSSSSLLGTLHLVDTHYNTPSSPEKFHLVTPTPLTQRQTFFSCLLYTVLQCLRDRRHRRSSQMKRKVIGMHLICGVSQRGGGVWSDPISICLSSVRWEHGGNTEKVMCMRDMTMFIRIDTNAYNRDPTPNRTAAQ